jgi:hypothetical protein
MSDNEGYEFETDYYPPYIEYYLENKQQVITWFLEKKLKEKLIEDTFEEFLLQYEQEFDEFKKECYNEACDEISTQNSLFKSR